MKNTALVVSGIIFLLMAIAHTFRYYRGFDVVVDNAVMPVDWSIYGAVIGLVLAIWMFIAAARK